MKDFKNDLILKHFDGFVIFSIFSRFLKIFQSQNYFFSNFVTALFRDRNGLVTLNDIELLN
jgi:hypothetical protein